MDKYNSGEADKRQKLDKCVDNYLTGVVGATPITLTRGLHEGDTLMPLKKGTNVQSR